MTKDLLKIKYIVVAIFNAAFVFALILSVVLGMYTACARGGGTLYKFACVQPVSVGTCYDVGTRQAYIIPNEYIYRELYENGSLSTETYSEEYIQNLTK